MTRRKPKRHTFVMSQKERLRLRPERMSIRAAVGTKTRQQYVPSRERGFVRPGSRAISM